MGQPDPGAARVPATAQEGKSTSGRAAVLRIKRGSKTLSQIGLARTKVVVGGGKTAQLRLKNAGLADECVLLDLRETPFTLVGLGPDQVFVNGWAVRKTNVRPGDRIEFSGITLELLDPEGGAPEASAPKPNGKGHSNGNGNGNGAARDSVSDDPYMGRETAARVFERSQLEGRVEKLEAPGQPKIQAKVEAR